MHWRCIPFRQPSGRQMLPFRRHPTAWVAANMTNGITHEPVFQIHPDNPQVRLIRQAVEIVRQGKVIVYPTDSGYALGCGIGEKTATDRIRMIRPVG